MDGAAWCAGLFEGGGTTAQFGRPASVTAEPFLRWEGMNSPWSG